MSLHQQLVRVGGIDVGILLSKADEEGENRRASPGTNTTTFWVVSVEGDSNDEEMISEKALGRVIDESDESVKSATLEKSAKKPVKKVTKAKNKVNSRKKGNRMNTRATTKDGPASPAELDDGIEFDRRAPSPRPKKKKGDETVVEVKMLTGTLFIYRGQNHRVEFVRTV